MEKKSKIIIAAIIVVVLGAFFGGVYIYENNLRTPDSSLITVKFHDAKLGSYVKAELTEDGKSKFSKAVNFAVYSDEGKRLSAAPKELGEYSLLYPKTEPGVKVTVYLIDENETIIEKIKTKIIKQ